MPSDCLLRRLTSETVEGRGVLADRAARGRRSGYQEQAYLEVCTTAMVRGDRSGDQGSVDDFMSKIIGLRRSRPAQGICSTSLASACGAMRKVHIAYRRDPTLLLSRHALRSRRSTRGLPQHRGRAGSSTPTQASRTCSEGFTTGTQRVPDASRLRWTMICKSRRACVLTSDGRTLHPSTSPSSRASRRLNETGGTRSGRHVGRHPGSARAILSRRPTPICAFGELATMRELSRRR